MSDIDGLSFWRRRSEFQRYAEQMNIDALRERAQRASDERRDACLLTDLTLPPRLKALVRETSENAGVSEGAVLCSILSSISVAAQGAWRIELERYKPAVPLSLWFLVEMNSGQGKSPLVDYLESACYGVFEEVENRYRQAEKLYGAQRTRWQLRRRALEAELKKAARKGEDLEDLTQALLAHDYDEPQKPLPLTRNLSDVSKSGLIKFAQKAMPTLNIHSAEGGVVLDRLNSEVMLLANALWRVEEYDLQRANFSGKIKGVPLSVMVYAQERAVRRFLDKSGSYAWETGFLGRFFVCRGVSSAEAKTMLNGGWRTDERNRFSATIQALYIDQFSTDFTKMKPYRTLELSEGARVRYEDFKGKIRLDLARDETMKRIEPFCLKLPEMIGRLAGLIQIYEKGNGLSASNRIDVATMDFALAIGKEFLKAYAAFFGDHYGFTAEEKEELLGWRWFYKECLEKGIKEVECRRFLQFSPLRREAQRDRAIERLVSKGFVRREMNRHKRREVVVMLPKGFEAIGM